MDDQNEVVVPETTKQKKSPALTIVLILVALMGIGFGVYGMFFNKSTDTSKCPVETTCDNSETTSGDKDNTKKNDEDYTVYYELVNKYMDYDLYSNIKKFTTNGFDDKDYMASVAMKYIDRNYINDGKYIINGTEMYGEYVKYGGFLAMVNNLFGENDYSGIFEEFNTGCAIYRLSAQDSLQSEGLGCGGTKNSQSINSIINVMKNEESLIIDVISAEISDVPEDAGYSGATEVILTDKNGNEAFSGEYTDIRKGGLDAETYFKDHLDEFQTYRLTFKKSSEYHGPSLYRLSNDHYYLESGEKID